MIIIAEMTVTGRQETIATVQSQDPGPLDAKDHLVHTETIPGTGTVTAILRIDIEMNARPEVTEIRNAGNFVCSTLSIVFAGEMADSKFNSGNVYLKEIAITQQQTFRSQIPRRKAARQRSINQRIW